MKKSGRFPFIKPFARFLVTGLLDSFNLIYRPSTWKKHLARINSTIKPDFSLLDITLQDWKNPAFQKFIYRLFLVPFLWVPGIICFVGLFRGWTTLQLQQALLFGCMAQLSGNIIFSTLTSAAAGSIFSMILGTGLGLLTPEQINNVYLPFGISLGIAASILVTLTHTPKKIEILSILRGLFTAVVMLGLTHLAGLLILSGILESNFNFPQAGIQVTNPALRLQFRGEILISFGSIILVTLLLRGHRVRVSLLIAIALGLIAGIQYSIYLRLPLVSPLLHLFGGLGGGYLLSTLFSLLWVITVPTAGRWPGATAAALAAGLFWIPFHSLFLADFEYNNSRVANLVVIIILSLTRNYWRPLIVYPLLSIWNRVLFFFDRNHPFNKNPVLRFHPVYWSELQNLPWYDLDSHLVMIAERNPELGNAYIQKLIGTRQNWAVQAARLELVARRMEKCQTIAQISQGYKTCLSHEVPGITSPLFNSLAQTSQDIEYALQQPNPYHKRLALGLVRDRLQAIKQEMMVSNRSFSARFSPLISQWDKSVENYLQSLAEVSAQGSPINNPYICGTPITPDQQMFVGRVDIITRVETLLLDPSSSPLLLYGQRRMGKTSLMLNLARILPSSFIPLFIDCQGLSGVNTYTDLLAGLARQMLKAASRSWNIDLPPYNLAPQHAVNPFIKFHLWLDEIESTLNTNGLKLLLMLDEFETLDRSLNQMDLPLEHFLNLLRNIIQHRPRFKVLLAGSHTLDEFIPWASHLVNTQVIKINYLEKNEARQLIEHPVLDFPIQYHPESVEMILEITRGHPLLIQQICFELIELINEDPAGRQMIVSLPDIQKAIPRALKSGSMFFLDIQHNQIPPLSVNLLTTLASKGSNAVIDFSILQDEYSGSLAGAIQSLLQRDLIESAPGGYRFQIELVRQWFTSGESDLTSSHSRAIIPL